METNILKRDINQEYNCKKENLKCRTLIERNTQGKPKYRDEKGIKYPDIENFQNKTSLLPEIEIKESLKKKKGNVISPKKKEEQLR